MEAEHKTDASGSGSNGAANGNGNGSNGRKRVRFSEETEVVRIGAAVLHMEMPDAKRASPLLGERGPAWPAGEGRARHVSACADDTMMAPDVAASKRAQLRSRMQRQRGGAAGGRDDGDDDWAGLEGAEEDYDEPEERYNDAGIPIEPFHMRKEREEGYFDEDGNYIEYRLQDIDDAWLDSLQDDPAAIDAALAAQLAVRGTGGVHEQEGDDEPPAMDSDDAAIYKRRVVELLRPGETVLGALRRLGGMQQHPSSPRAHKRAVRKTKQSGQQEASRLGHQDQSPGAAAPTGPASIGTAAAAPDIFMASLAPAMPAGASASSPAAVRPAPGSSAAASTPPTPAAVVAAAAASLSGAAGASTSSGQRSAHGHSGSGAEPVAGRQRMRAEDSIPFDKLTEYADLLLGSGDFGIYEASREQLLRQLQATSLQDSLVEDSVDLSSVARPQEQQAQQAQQQQQQQQQQQAAPAVDADVDMFGGDDNDVGGVDAAAAVSSAAPSAAGAGNGSGPGSSTAAHIADVGGGGGDAAMADAQEPGSHAIGGQQASHAAGNGVVVAPGGTVSGASTAAADAEAGQSAADAAAAGSSGAPAGVQAALEGFVFDGSTGYYYNSSLGYYYSPETCLFGDSSTGQWYRYHESDGRYELAA